MVSAFAYERLGPEFSNPGACSPIFLFTILKWEEKGAVPTSAIYTSTSTITHNYHTSNWWSRRDQQRREVTVIALPRLHHCESKTVETGSTATTNTKRLFRLQRTLTPHLWSTQAGDRIRDDDWARNGAANAKSMGISPLHVILKKNGGLRPYVKTSGPYWQIHRHIEDFAQHLHGFNNKRPTPYERGHTTICTTQRRNVITDKGLLWQHSTATIVERRQRNG